MTHNPAINPWVVKTLQKLNPRRVVDAGSGRGYYGKMISGCLKDCIVIGVEIYEPYLKAYPNLKKYYLKMILGDIREVIHEEEMYGDLIIFGDILEHLLKEDVHPLLRESIKKFRYILVSAPIGFTPQIRPKKGDNISFKNLHERHLCGLT
ncbi:unnamed protein product, partial [marine sediment metagenome]